MTKQVFLWVLFPLLFAGCSQEYATARYPERSDEAHHSPSESISGRPHENEANPVTIAEPNGVLTLGQVLALTLMHNPELKAYSLETRAAQARQLQAGLRPNPELAVELENVAGSGPLRGFDGAESTIQLSQLIELGDKAQKRQKVASFEKELADLDYQDNKLEIFTDSARAFILVLKAQEKLRLSHELLKLSEESYAAVEKRVNAGKDSPLEQNRAAVALSNRKISHLETQRNLDYARKQLSLFWGQETPQFERAAGNLESLEPLPAREELTPRLKQTPRYTRWETEIKRNRAALDLEQSRAMGDVTLGAGVRRFNETDENAFVFGVSIPLPVSDRNQGARQEAIYNIAKSRQKQKASWLQLQSELNQVYQEYASAYHQAVSFKTEVLPASAQLYRAAARAYQEGKTGYLDVLDAQRTWFAANNDYIESLAACHIHKAELERFCGQLLKPVQSTEK